MRNELPSRWLSLNDVCRLTSLSRTTINNWRERGEFVMPVEIGGRVAFIRDEVEAWMAAYENRRQAHDRIGRRAAA